jgi:hypothetical protein
MAFLQSTTAHCEADALAHVQRDNPHAKTVEPIGKFDMGFGDLTMYRFEVTLPERPVVWYVELSKSYR